MHTTSLGESWDKVGCALAKLCGGEHRSLELGLVKMGDGFNWCVGRFYVSRPAPEIIPFQQLRLKIHTHSLARSQGHRVQPGEKNGGINCLRCSGSIGKTHAIGQ